MPFDNGCEIRLVGLGDLKAFRWGVEFGSDAETRSRRYRCTTAGAAVCSAPCRPGAVERVRFAGAAGLAVVEAVGLFSAGALAAAGGGSSGGSTVSFWMAFSIARSLATFF